MELTPAQLEKIDAQVLAKFKSVFGKLMKTVDLNDEEDMEELKDTFWVEIVEAGWQPREIDVLSNKHVIDELCDIQTASQLKACQALGIPAEVVEL